MCGARTVIQHLCDDVFLFCSTASSSGLGLTGSLVETKRSNTLTAGATAGSGGGGSNAVSLSAPLSSSSSSSSSTVALQTVVPGNSEVLSVEWDAKTDNLLAFGCANSKIKARSEQVSLPFIARCAPSSGMSRRRGLCAKWRLPRCDVASRDSSRSTIRSRQDYPCVLELASSPTDAVFVSSSASRVHDTLEGGKGVRSSVQRARLDADRHALPQELILWSLQTGKRVNTFHIESSLSQVNSMVINHNGDPSCRDVAFKHTFCRQHVGGGRCGRHDSRIRHVHRHVHHALARARTTSHQVRETC